LLDPFPVDVARAPEVRQRKRRRRLLTVLALLAGVAAASLALARLEPAVPTVARGSLVLDKVTRGSFTREVPGLGTLVPEDTRWLPATTNGRVERILLRPGAVVRAESVILVLSNPEVEQQTLTAQLALQAAEATLENLRAQLQNDLLTQRSQVAGLDADYKQALMEAEANDILAKQKLVSTLVLRQSQLKADTFRTRLEIETRRLAVSTESVDARTRVQQAAVEQARAVVDLNRSRLDALQVRPGFDGVLQQVPVEVGQQVAPGQNLARVADPRRLKAELKISETQAKDVEVGQLAQVDTRIGIIAGRVSRKDPAAANGTVTVDVMLTAELPRGAVPDQSIDGTVELERVENVLRVGRSSIGQERSAIALFRVIDAAGTAERTEVRIGRTSVGMMEVVDGLKEGDQIILSDMSAWDAVKRVRLR
jgi:HlyD family secretion protein